MTNVNAPETAPLSQTWPAYALSALVLAAATYAFSPRPLPPFPETRVFPDKILVNGLAQSGTHLIAVGEGGHILNAESSNGPWQEAKVEPQRGSTLTAVHSTDGLVFAGGHDGWILRSEDQGQNWKEVAFDTEHPDPILGIAGPYNGKMFAVGGFGTYLTSMDQGKTWQRESLTEQESGKPEPKLDLPSADEDPFAAFSAGQESGIADRHLNGITAAPDGALILVGERGLLARSTDQGQTWKQIPDIYNGSFFGVLALPPQGLLIYGMRGNAFYSADLGQSWKKSEVPGGLSLFGAALMSDGRVVLAGEASTVMVSADQGASFKVISQGERLRFASILPASGGWLAGGEGGLRHIAAGSATGAQP